MVMRNTHILKETKIKKLVLLYGGFVHQLCHLFSHSSTARPTFASNAWDTIAPLRGACNAFSDTYGTHTSAYS